MIPNLKLYLIIAAFVSSVGGSIYFTSKYKDGQYAIKERKARDEYIVELKKRQDEYNKKVEELNKEALKRQTELANLNSELERKYANANKRAEQALTKYNDLVTNGWRLRDPGSEPQPTVQLSHTSSNSDSSTSNSCNGTTRGRELSREASEFLLRFASDADKVVEQLRVAQEYALRLKQICEKQ
jgi:hypothetical protein